MNPYTGTKPANFADTSKSDFPLNLGIYKGLVRKIDTGIRNGRLYVYIPHFGGDDVDVEANWTPVTYASPYGGFTPGPSNATSNDYYSTQQSYGFYATPPDIGNIVLCCFPDGDRTEGYWFACINPNLSRYMIPSIGSVTVDQIDQASVPPDLTPFLKSDGKYPVSEFNNLIIPTGADWFKTPKPLHIPQTVRLIQQGLDQDPTRGAISSSSQRDPISAVVGLSTPGRPVPSQDPAYKYTKEQIASGNFNPEDLQVTTRIGGHSLTMDDGDISNSNNLVRLKTAAGHQIMMNDSEGFIYISNATGNAWVELTKEGDVLIYGRRDLSIRTQGNLMMHSDHDISLNAERNLKLYAGGTTAIQSQAVSVNATQFLNMYGRQTQVKSGGAMALTSVSSMSIKAGGAMALNAGMIALNGGGGGGSSAAPNPLPQYPLPDTVYANGQWVVANPAIQSTNYKVPTHEPYIRGSVAKIVELQTQAAEDLTAPTYNVVGDQISPPTNINVDGLAQANSEPVTNPAPTSAFITQTDPQDGIGVLDKDQLKAYMAQVGNSSNNVYNSQDQFGNQGKYSLGTAALQSTGYLREGTPQTAEAMSNPNNWTGKNGIYSSTDFQLSPQIQDQVMYDYTRSNYAALQNAGVVNSTTTADKVAGLLSASHPETIGVDGAIKYAADGTTTRDLNGTTVSTYYNQGRYSQTQLPVIQASNQSKVTS
jgi:hypothetical protein